MATVIADINIVDTENSYEVVDVSNREFIMMFSVMVGEIWELRFMFSYLFVSSQNS